MSNDTPSTYNLKLENSAAPLLQSYWFSHMAEGKTPSYGAGVNLGSNAQSACIPIQVIGGEDDYWTVSVVDDKGHLYSTELLQKANVASGLPQDTTITLDVVPSSGSQLQVNIEYPGYKAGPLTLQLFGQHYVPS